MHIKCVICEKEIGVARKQRWPLTKTCSTECSEENFKALKRKANRASQRRRLKILKDNYRVKDENNCGKGGWRERALAAEKRLAELGNADNTA